MYDVYMYVLSYSVHLRGQVVYSAARAPTEFESAIPGQACELGRYECGLGEHSAGTAHRHRQ